MHWINFPLMMIMVWSGIRIYNANDVYSISLFGFTFFDFFPESVSETLELDRKLAKGIGYHLTFGWLFAINGVAYAIYLLKSGEWRHVWPDRHTFREARQVVAHDVHLRKDAPTPGRYNAAQRLAYGAVLAMGAIILLTGFAIYKPAQLSPLTWVFGGYESARTIHFITTIGFMLFFLVHILQVIRAGWRNFASMITGYELEPRRRGDTAPIAAPAEEEVST